MNPKAHARFSSGFTLLELVVVISIIGILGMALSERLQTYAETAEKTSMEYVANTVNAALLMEFASRVIHGQRSQVAELEKINPVNLLAQKPSNYLGEFGAAPLDGDLPGNWYYDTAERELVYVVRRTDHFEPDSTGQNRVRYRVKLIYDNDGPNGEKRGPVGAVVSPVEPYKWFWVARRRGSNDRGAGAAIDESYAGQYGQGDGELPECRSA